MDDINPNNPETTWLVVVRVSGVVLNHLIKARYDMEAFGAVKQLYPDKPIGLLLSISEKANPALVRAIRFDQNSHHLPGDVLALIEPLQTGELMTPEEEADPMLFRPQVDTNIFKEGNAR